MSIFFNSSEILQFAIRIEENGEKFYRHATKMTENKNARKMFDYLAGEEISHKKTFEDLLSELEAYTPFESYPGEYFEYLKVFVDKVIFANEMFEKKILGIIDTPSAINFGIQRELESILYFHEIKKFVPESHHKLIDKIIDQERNHFSKLAGFIKRYDR